MAIGWHVQAPPPHEEVVTWRHSRSASPSHFVHHDSQIRQWAFCALLGFEHLWRICAARDGGGFLHLAQPVDLEDDPSLWIRALDVLNSPHPVFVLVLRNLALLGWDQRQRVVKCPHTEEAALRYVNAAVAHGDVLTRRHGGIRRALS